MSIALTVFQGRAGDHNDLAMPGAKAIGDQLGAMLGLVPLTIGHPEAALSTDWRTELDHALPALRMVQRRLEQIFLDGDKPLSATSRCAVSLATLPVVAKFRQDACIVWFDAHADLNTPASTGSGYLGGLALSGPAGLWESGIGAFNRSAFNVEMRVRWARHVSSPEKQKLIPDRSPLSSPTPRFEQGTCSVHPRK